MDLFYFKCNDGIGGAKTNNWAMRAAINMTQEFIECSKEEYEEAMRLAEQDDVDDEDD